MFPSTIAVSHEVIDTWDTEARQNAQEQAQSIRRDKDAAMMLQAHIAASSPLERQSDLQSRHFKPMALYARVAHFYHFSDKEMRKMHYPRFFAYVREANEIIAEQKRIQPNNNNHVHGSLMVDNPELAQMMLRKQFGKPQEYQGEVVRLND